MTDGSVITDDMAISGKYDVMFLKSPSGSITSTVTRNVMISIKR